MAKSQFIEIESVDGVVQHVVGSLEEDRSFLETILGSGPTNWHGRRLTDLLNYCAQLGYEHFDTDTFGSRKIYRMKLKTSLGDWH